MLAVARALMNENDLLLVDEPTEGLSPLLAKNLIASLDRLKEIATILLVEQNFRTVSKLGDNYYIFDSGKIVSANDWRHSRQTYSDVAWLSASGVCSWR